MSVRRGFNLTAWLFVAALATQPATAKKQDPDTWRALRTSDPITGATSCVVTASDYVGKDRFTRTGGLYPIVEMNAKNGLLVGVSSGGRYRLPTGDILWRVDDRPFRELKAVDNPVPDNQPVAAGSDAMALVMRQALGASATSTVASGDKAKEMLAELRGGHTLIFRASAAAASYGLPDLNAQRVGQMTDKGLRPIPIDASFTAALEECRIGE